MGRESILGGNSVGFDWKRAEGSSAVDFSWREDTQAMALDGLVHAEIERYVLLLLLHYYHNSDRLPPSNLFSSYYFLGLSCHYFATEKEVAGDYGKRSMSTDEVP